jgi:predicted amidophosphoribosyltransferase
MTEAATTAEVLVSSYPTTRRNNPEGSHLRNHCRENLKNNFRVPKGREYFYYLVKRL